MLDVTLFHLLPKETSLEWVYLDGVPLYVSLLFVLLLFWLNWNGSKTMSDDVKWVEEIMFGCYNIEIITKLFNQNRIIVKRWMIK